MTIPPSSERKLHPTTSTPAEAFGNGQRAGNPLTDRSPRRRILVVDDERSILRTTRRVLEANHDVVTTEDAREALSLIAAGENFDLVLSDVAMPHLSGKGLYEAALAMNPGLASRFVFVTGGTPDPDLVKFLASVSNERIAKPYRIEQLLDVTRRSLETHYREAPQP